MFHVAMIIVVGPERNEKLIHLQAIRPISGGIDISSFFIAIEAGLGEM